MEQKLNIEAQDGRIIAYLTGLHSEEQLKEVPDLPGVLVVRTANAIHSILATSSLSDLIGQAVSWTAGESCVDFYATRTECAASALAREWQARLNRSRLACA